MIIYGTAGTGKSFLIRAIAQLLGSACLLTGTTGIAGFNICGITLHSALQLHCNSAVAKTSMKVPLAGLPDRIGGPSASNSALQRAFVLDLSAVQWFLSS